MQITKRDGSKQELDLNVVATYTIAEAIADKIISDYQITIVKAPLDNVVQQDFKGKIRTEKKQFDSVSWVIDKLDKEGKNTMFLRLARMRLIQNSLAKKLLTSILSTPILN